LFFPPHPTFPPPPIFTNMGRMGKQLRERFSLQAMCCCRGRVVAASSQFLIENVWRLLFCGRKLKQKIVTRVTNGTLAVRLLMFLFHVWFCFHQPLASRMYKYSQCFPYSSIRPTDTNGQVCACSQVSRYTKIRHWTTDSRG
jgi:hypothetical protein